MKEQSLRYEGAPPALPLPRRPLDRQVPRTRQERVGVATTNTVIGSRAPAAGAALADIPVNGLLSVAAR